MLTDTPKSEASTVAAGCANPPEVPSGTAGPHAEYPISGDGFPFAPLSRARGRDTTRRALVSARPADAGWLPPLTLGGEVRPEVRT